MYKTTVRDKFKIFKINRLIYRYLNTNSNIYNNLKAEWNEFGWPDADLFYDIWRALIESFILRNPMSKTIVLTGAGGVLCSTLAIALAKQGHNIAVLDLRKEAADAIADEIKATGGKALGVMGNVLEKTRWKS